LIKGRPQRQHPGYAQNPLSPAGLPGIQPDRQPEENLRSARVHPADRPAELFNKIPGYVLIFLLAVTKKNPVTFP